MAVSSFSYRTWLCQLVDIWGEFSPVHMSGEWPVAVVKTGERASCAKSSESSGQFKISFASVSLTCDSRASEMRLTGADELLD